MVREGLDVEFTVMVPDSDDGFICAVEWQVPLA
jgi:hypothetical protein